MTEEPLYIGISSPIALRKTLLLCSRDVITSLKNYEAYKEISKQVIDMSYELRKAIEELVVLNRKLRQALPKSKRIIPKQEPKKVSGKTISKIQDLEKALDKIESKLKSMK